MADRGRAVQQCVDQREPDDVRLRARGRRTGQSRLGRREVRIDLDPSLAGSWVERKRAVLGGELQGEADSVADLSQLVGVEGAAERQQLGAVDRATSRKRFWNPLASSVAVR